MGFGIVNYLEPPGAAPDERTDIAVRTDGRVEATIRIQASGQGNETSFAQVAAEAPRIPIANVSIIFNDTDKVVDGLGSHADWSMQLGGTVLVRASEKMLAESREWATELLEAADADIRNADGRFNVAGTDRSLGLFGIAAPAPLTAAERSRLGSTRAQIASPPARSKSTLRRVCSS